VWADAYQFDPNKTHIIENEYPAEREYVPAVSRQLVAGGRPIFLKNTVLLEKVVADLSETYPDLTVDTRAVTPDAHRARLRDAYAVVIPSISEVSPNTAIEAVRYGKPCIVTADTGIQERLADVCMFVDTRDPVALRHAIEQMLDPATYEQMMARIRTFSFVHPWKDIVREYRERIQTI
jgi:glycosyltransferase involved in cell wall biosynthesis